MCSRCMVRALRRTADKRTGAVRIAVIAERDRAYGRELCCGIAEAARHEERWSLSFVEADALKTQKALDVFDGVIARVADDAMAARLEASRLPVVDVFCTKRYSNFGSVDGDQSEIGRKAAEYFLARRFTSFAYCGYEGYGYSDERRDAFAAALKSHFFGCSVFKTPQRALVEYGASVTRKEDVTLGADAQSLARWLKGLPPRTALFCCHDMRAYQVLRICKDEGIAVPDSLAVLGVDNDPLVCSFISPSISSIDNGGFRVGSAAVAALSRMMRSKAARKNPPAVRVKPGEVVQRQSTEAYAFEEKWMSDALVYISRNVEKRLTAEDVARFAGRSLPTVEDAFRRALGRTVQQELVASRLFAARRLLESTSLPVAEVAARSGFASAQYFCRMFKADTGLSAERWRGQNNASRRLGE